LHYRTSKLPVAADPAAHEWSVNLFGPVQDGLGGPMIEGVTYPSFTTDGNHFTLYLRLNGGSGSADSCFFEYANGRWLINDPKAGKLIDKNWSVNGLVLKVDTSPDPLSSGCGMAAWPLVSKIGVEKE